MTHPLRRPRDGHAATDPHSGAAARETVRRDLSNELATALDQAPSGIAFVYGALDLVRDVCGESDVLLVLDDPVLGRQAFRSDRKAPVGPSTDSLDRLDPGLYAGGLRLGADVAEVVLSMCRVALRVDTLGHDAARDSLTGLFNRRSLDDAAAQAVARSSRYGWPFTLVLIDIDRFKAVNDRFGHDGGDAVLRAVGRELRTALRGGDVAARIGGDEFALLLANGAGDAIEGLLQRLDARLRSVLAGTGAGLSAGYALCPDETTELPELFKLADQRLYEAKRR